ncbi:aminoacyl-tRNA hydrolase [Candidatus Mycoplasma haematohominis]|uniref:Peptidyl-tRNA hydrolase n=1 Tax=Candidatus Mycoplasma haematohominis TaxID=1494318 RepID=A0A478FS47_9MOLU|nr:aminoacyl-tRNA hydrolase [Candidatus Mycoplasma haemohominis]GCE63279.1 peptidyl-tRNA hydrolase [Candidatus Mycoplasma haemohominis]
MKLIVGLGNPGSKFENTRHNVGFIVVDSFVEFLSNKFGDSVVWRVEHQGLVCKSSSVIFFKPITYMNLSGNAVCSLKNFYKISNSDILIVYDDLYLAEGKYRFSINRNSGGHNGVKNIIEKLGGKDFLTLRVGIGPREKATVISDYVLENMSEETMDNIGSLYQTIFEAMEFFIDGANISELQNKYNR